MKVLVATEKPFAKIAVDGIREVVEKNGYELALLEKYTDVNDLYKAVADADESYAAGELKHGTIALIAEGVPVIAVATQKHVYSKTISNIREVKARGAYVILLSMDEKITDDSICDVHISLPQVPDEFAIFEAVVILQLIAYYTSVGKGLNPDQPRNLAKSVTVE